MNRNQFKNIGYILIGVLLVFISIGVINLFMIIETPIPVGKDNDWIGFWGGILGSGISGIITFIALKITIDNENKKRHEDKRMEVMPYLSYICEKTTEYIKVDQEYMESKDICGIIHNMCLLCTQDTKRSKEEDGYPLDIQIILVIENLGVGIAIEPRVVSIEYFGEVITPVDERKIVLGQGKRGIVEMLVTLPKEEGYDFDRECPKAKLVIGYFNVLRDYYEQEVEILMSLGMVPKDGNWSNGIKLVYGNNELKYISEAQIVKNKYPFN